MPTVSTSAAGPSSTSLARLSPVSPISCTSAIVPGPSSSSRASAMRPKPQAIQATPNSTAPMIGR